MEKSKHIIWFIFTVSKRLLVCYVSQTYLANIFCTFKDPSNMSLVRYECLKDFFYVMNILKRRLLYVMNVKDVFCTLWMS